MATENINAMVSKERFEGLLKYYSKMNVGQFVKQWVTPELYFQILEQTQTTQILLLWGKKDHPNFQCIYCGGEWYSKLRLFDRMVKGCEFGPFHLSTKNRIPLFVFLNLHGAQMSKLMKSTMESNNGCALSFKLRMQLKVDAK